MAKRDKQGLELRRILAENVRAYRRQRNLSQEDLAEICGLHRTYVGSVERAERNVTLSTLEAFATGETFFSRFPQFQGKVVNKKLQIPLPADFFNR